VKPEIEKINDLSSATAYLYSHLNYEKINLQRSQKNVFSLDCITALLRELGNPHSQTPMVHVTGTVGKGSTTSMIASMLEGGGYKVGQFTSPHLYDIRERFLINKKLMPEADFVSLIETVAKAAAKCEFTPTFFELVTAAGFSHFAREKVDIAVIEVGFGGRLDSTNIISPLASVITAIGLDHTHILGDTLAQIAKEKSGIFKPRVPAFCFSQSSELNTVFQQAALESSTPLNILGKDIEFSSHSSNEGDAYKTYVSVKSPSFNHTNIPVPLSGKHQATNCALAISALETLRQSGFTMSDETLLAGLSQTRAPGRMELIAKEPAILIDVAHNSLAIQSLMEHVSKHIKYTSLITIFGCCRDKNQAEMILPLLKYSNKLIFTRAQNNPRAADPEDLYNICPGDNRNCHHAPGLKAAMEIALRDRQAGSLILITGSFYLVAETRDLPYFRKLTNSEITDNRQRLRD